MSNSSDRSNSPSPPLPSLAPVASWRLEMSDFDLIKLIKENITLQVGYDFKGHFARAAFEANCLLFEEATRRGIVDYSGQSRPHR